MKVSILILLPALLCTIGASPVPADGDENRSTGVSGQLFNIFADPLNIGGIFGKTATTEKPYDYKYPNKPQEYKPQQYKPQDYNNGNKPMMPNKYPANYNKPGPDHKPAKPYGGSYNKPSSYEYGNQEKPLNIYINIPAVPAVAKPTKPPTTTPYPTYSYSSAAPSTTTAPPPYYYTNAPPSTTTAAPSSTAAPPPYYYTTAAPSSTTAPPPYYYTNAPPSTTTAAPSTTTAPPPYGYYYNNAVPSSITAPANQTIFPSIAAYQPPMVSPPMTAAPMAPQPPMAAPYPLLPIAQSPLPAQRPQDYMYGPHM